MHIGAEVQAFQAQKEAIKLRLTNADLPQKIAKIWLERGRSTEAKDMLELALRARVAKESTQSQNRIEEFLKSAEALAGKPEELRQKFKEVLVKGNLAKEDDWAANQYLDLLAAKSAE